MSLKTYWNYELTDEDIAMINKTTGLSDESIEKIRNMNYSEKLIINSLWSLIFFGFEAYLLAFIWIIILLISVIIMIVNFYKVNKTAAYLQIPYVLWIIFAGYLNLGIYLLNR